MTTTTTGDLRTGDFQAGYCPERPEGDEPRG